MAERAIFLDRDNTIIEDKEGYIGDPAKVKLMPGAATAIASMRRLGYRMIVVSNQSGVARGLFDEAAVEAVNQEMCKQLREQASAHIDASYYCPYHPDGSVPEYRMEHDWRKPRPGMLRQAVEDFGLDITQCWMIGDSLRDVEAGLAAGCRTILLKEAESVPVSEETARTVTPHFLVKSLADATRIIAREGRAPYPPSSPPSPPSSSSSHTAEAITLSSTPAPEETKVAAGNGININPLEEQKPQEPAASAAAEPTTETVEELVVQVPEEKIEGAGESALPPEPTPAADLPSTPSAPPAARRAVVQSNLPKSETFVEKTGGAGEVKPILDEILALLRHRHRAHEIPEFTLSMLVAYLAQIAVFACMVVAGSYWLRGFPTANMDDWAERTASLQNAIVWMLVAVVMQVFVLTMKYTRNR